MLKSIKAIENVPNVLNVIRVFSSFIKTSKCKTSFNKTRKIRTDPIIKNMLLKSVNILPNDRIAKISPVIAKGRFFIMFIIIFFKKEFNKTLLKSLKLKNNLKHSFIKKEIR